MPDIRTEATSVSELEAVVADLVELVKSYVPSGASPCKRGRSGTCAAHGWLSPIETCPVGRAYALGVQDAALCVHCGINASTHANRFTRAAGWHVWAGPDGTAAA
ncbi:hypothetical protein OHR86_28195 [Streptomyces sp. NBC_00441]|uniref:hypothetical protein n=1 Tax=Streptomyces sp. NBC_00441 TaxID=2975742 RepID=UPI002E2E1406|nr:hypothetical protein [Streptomyces sp. NBC_00441]